MILFINFHATFLLGKVTEAALGGLKIPHSLQHSQIVVLAPSKAWKCNHNEK